MKLPQPQKETRQQVELSTCIVLTGLSYLLTPLIIRTIADGVIPTHDFSALAFLMVLVVLVEVFGMGAAFLFRQNIELHNLEANQTLKKLLLEKVAERRTPIQLSYLFRVIQKEVVDFNYSVIKQKWIDYQDAFLVLLLISAAVIINFRFGFLITAIICLNQIALWAINIFSKQNSQQYQFFEEDESALLQQWFRNLKGYWDRLEANDRLEPVLVSFQKVGARSRELFRLNGLGEMLNRGTKMIAVALAILVIAAEPGSNQTSGTIFALIVIVYRITGPMGRLGKSLLNRHRGFTSFTKIRLLFEELETVPSIQGKKDRKLFQVMTRLKAEKKHSVFFASPDLAVTLNESIKTWQMLYFNREAFVYGDAESSFKPSNVKLFVQLPTGNQIELSRTLRQGLSNACFWQLGFPTEALPTNFQGFLVSTSEGDSLTLIPLNVGDELNAESLESLFKIWASWSETFHMFTRDIERICKTHTPFVLLVTRPGMTGYRTEILKQIRNSDFYIELPNSAALLAFMGSEEQGLEKICRRFVKAQIPQYLLQVEHAQYFKNQGDSRPHLARAKAFVIAELLSSLQRVDQERRVA